MTTPTDPRASASTLTEGALATLLLSFEERWSIQGRHVAAPINPAANTIPPSTSGGSSRRS